MKVKDKSEKAELMLKLNIQKTNIMASGPITSWQTDGGKVEAVADFIFLGSKIAADSDCSHIVKAMVFPVVMYGYESWTIKKAENRRIDAFELWC